MLFEWIGLLTRDTRRTERLRKLIQASPRSVVLALMRLVGFVVFVVAGRFRRTVLRNIRAALPRLGPLASLRMTRRWFSEVAMTVMEQTLDCAVLGKRGHEMFEVAGFEHIDAALEAGQGAVVVAPHVGNYFYYYWLLSQRYRCLSVFTGAGRDVRPLYFHFYQETGCMALDHDSEPADQLLAKLQQHLFSNGVVFLLSDFYRGATVPTTLFGKPNRTPPGAVALALQQEAPIVPLVGYRAQGFRHKVRIDPPVYFHREFGLHQVEAATVELSKILEDLVLVAPEQWLYWFDVHTRWET